MRVQHKAQVKNRAPILQMISALLIAGVLAQPVHAEELTVTANEKLEWDQNNKVYIAKGDAFAAQGNRQITADIISAFYEDGPNDSREITRMEAAGSVEVVDQEQTITGAALIYDVNEGIYDIAGPNANVKSPDGTATADNQILYNRAAGRVFLRGDAMMRFADGRELAGDELDILLNENQEMDSMVATGNVVIRQADGRTSRSDTADYDAASGRALLTGNVEIIAEGNILNGQRAEIDFNKGISRLLPDAAGGRVTGTLTLKSGN